MSIYNQIQDPIVAMKAIGEAIAKSQMFGCQSVEQGQILALECLTQQIPVLSLAKRYDLMGGKLSMKSQTMLADFRDQGGKTKVIEKSPERAAIWMEDRDGNSYTFELTWEDAKKEAFPYNGKEKDIVALLDSNPEKLVLKSKYATPRSRATMLWNRLISDSVRTVAPEVNCGHYTAEEIEDFSPQVRENVFDRIAAGETIEEIQAEVKTPEPEVKTPEPESNPGKVDDSTKDELTRNARLISEAVRGEGVDPAEFTRNDNDTIDGATEQSLKGAISQAKQLGITDIVEQVRRVLEKGGISKLANLTYAEANKLRSAIDMKNLSQWLDSPLRSDESKNDPSQSKS